MLESRVQVARARSSVFSPLLVLLDPVAHRHARLRISPVAESVGAIFFLHVNCVLLLPKGHDATFMQTPLLYREMLLQQLDPRTER